MIIELLVGQLFLTLFNITNVYVDAYLIFDKKAVGHVVNFFAYLILVTVLCLLFDFNWLQSALFFLSAFFNRQFSFDIPLNLRRGLDWDYQTADTSSNASLLDRLERCVFGSDTNAGKRIFKAYFVCYAVIINILVWLI